MSHKSTSLNQGKFFNKKINSYKPLEKYESDILDISNKQYPYYNAKYREGFNAVNDADKIYDKDNGKEWIILSGYELRFNPNGVNITQPEEDSNTSGGLEQKQSIYSLDAEGFELLNVLKEASEDSNVYAAKIDKNSNVNKLYLYRKNASDNIPHATNSGQKIYPRVVPTSSTVSQNVHLLLRPGNGEIPENVPFSLTGNDEIMKKVGHKAKKMAQFKKEFNINKRAYEKKAQQYLEEKVNQYNKRSTIKTNVLYKIKNPNGNDHTYHYITPHAVKRQINFGEKTDKEKALSDAKCPIPETRDALPLDPDNMIQAGQEINLDHGEECGGGGYIVNKVQNDGTTPTGDYGWVDHTGRKFKLAAKPGTTSFDASTGKNFHNPHISCQAYMPAKKLKPGRWRDQFGSATPMTKDTKCSVTGTDDLEASMELYNQKMINIIGDENNGMFELATTQTDNTDHIDTIRNSIRTGAGHNPPQKNGEDDPEGEWSTLKNATSHTNSDGSTVGGINRPLNVVSNLLKRKKKILSQERAELNGLRTSNKIKKTQVDGMSLHYIAWVLAGLAIGGIVVKNLTKKAI